MYIMKEDTLTQIKNEVEITKLNIEKNNTMLNYTFSLIQY